jgi:hypothetical protein
MIDWSRYKSQLRPLTAGDYNMIHAIERQTDEELLRAARKEYARRDGVHPIVPTCDCEVCGDPTHRGGAGAPEEDEE